MMGDLGNGKFDGAWLVSNFENLNPANTYWSKHYNLYAKIDTEAPRVSRVRRLVGRPRTAQCRRDPIHRRRAVRWKQACHRPMVNKTAGLDFRNIGAPIVVFCSKGDNITPPPQALGWILDLYRNVEDIRAHGQTIVYAVHESAGHLGIFVAGSVAKKEHNEFASNIDMIEVLPPGLYEAVITPKGKERDPGDLMAGDYLVRFETRTLDDIRALGTNSEDDERRFAAVARISEINLGFYRTFMQPWIKLFADEGAAEWIRRMHPLRLQYELFSPANPFMDYVRSMADVIQPPQASNDNVFLQAQTAMSQWIETSLNSYRDMRDELSEALFNNVYGAPLLQAMTGLKASEGTPRRRPEVDAAYRTFVANRIAELKRNIDEGGPREAAVRAALYIRLPEGVADERGFRLLQRLQEEAGSELSLAEFEKVVMGSVLQFAARRAPRRQGDPGHAGERSRACFEDGSRARPPDRGRGCREPRRQGKAPRDGEAVQAKAGPRERIPRRGAPRARSRPEMLSGDTHLSAR